MYCTVDEVEKLAKTDFFAKMNVPGRDVLEAIANTVSDEIDGWLFKHGYTLPITDRALLKYCASLNAYGVAANLERKGDVSQDFKGFYAAKFDKGLSMLKDRRWVPYATHTAVTKSETEW